MANTINREWIAAELSKGTAAEQELADVARARRESPPDPALAALYGEIAEADDRHRTIIETVATRYGYTPTRAPGGGGIGDALSRLKGRISEMGTTPLERLGHDLMARANAIHWYNAWIAAFEAIGETQSARELAAVLTEETAHRDALQLGLNRLVLQGAQGDSDAT